jgi:hypothetical protein
MTAQISDRFIYKGQEFSLIGIEGEGLAKPEDFEMKPVAMHTACYRGFFSIYEITEKGIFLREMGIKEDMGNYKPINDVWPTMEEYGALYKDIDLLISFSGKIRLAKDFIEERYIHMGFQKPSAYETVIDLIFEDGRIVEINDRSKEVEAIRKSGKERYKKWRIFKKIKKSFELDMDLE